MIIFLNVFELLVQNFVEKFLKRVLYVLTFFCTCFKELVLILLGKLLCCLFVNLSLRFQVSLVAQDQNSNFIIKSFLKVFLPIGKIFEALYISNVIYHNCSLCLFVIASSNCFVLLLTSSVPELNLNQVVFVSIKCCGKINSYCSSCICLELLLCISVQYVGFSNT